MRDYPQTLLDAKKKLISMFKHEEWLAGVGITVSCDWALKINLRYDSENIRAQIPSSIDGYSIRVEYVGKIVAR